MSPERWNQLNRIFDQALAIPAAQQAAFLAEACGDDEQLRREIEELLAADAKDGALVEKPLGAVAANLFSELSSLRAIPETLIGKQFGEYRVLSEIGRGGMGEVFLAQDSKFGRRVALKLLPERFTSDQERVHRFRQEARAASGLNHPNIVTIFDIGQEDGRHFMATEFVEGQTLRAAINSGELTVPQSLDIAIQIASALAAAHAAGIVHRDIKPENIMLRPDGYVKVLDFGLAKLTEQTPSGSSSGRDSEAETRGAVQNSRFETRTGVLLGTVSYMSPEQARGQKVDARSDLFSLGVVLYELLTGKRPFDGATRNHVLVAILDAEPPPLANDLWQVQPMISRLLAKDRNERYPSASALLVELRQFKDELFAAQVRSNDPVLLGQPTTTPVQAHLKLGRFASSKRSVGLVLLFALVAFGGLGIWQWFRTRPMISFENLQVKRLPTNGLVDGGVISPDGKYVVYMLVEKDEICSLWLQQLSTNSNQQIVPPSRVFITGLSFSPDSAYVYYVAVSVNHSTGGELFRIPVIGGAPQRILSSNVSGSVCFSPDNRHMIYRSYNITSGLHELILANADGSAPRTLVAKGGPLMSTLDSYGWSARGDRIVYVSFSFDATSIFYYVAAQPLGGGPEQRLTAPGRPRIAGALELPDGSGLLLNVIEPGSGLAQLRAYSYADGSERRLTNDLSEYFEVSITADASKLLAIQKQEQRAIWVTPLAQPQNAQNITTRSDYETLAWTPDDKLVYSLRQNSNSELRLMTTDNSQQMLLVAAPNAISAPAVSPDNQTILYTRFYKKDKDSDLADSLWRMDADGRNQQLLQSEAGRANYSPDGRWIVYEARSNGKWTIWKMPAAGGSPTQITTETSHGPVVSPDGKWLAYESVVVEGRRSRIVVQSFEGGAPARTFGAQPSYGPLGWTADSRALLYIELGKTIKQQALAGGAAQTLMTAPNGETLRWFALSRDRKRLAFISHFRMHSLVLFTHPN